MFELFDGSNRTDTTDIFVVNLKNGEVKGPFPTPYTFSTHHVNAYEEKLQSHYKKHGPEKLQQFEINYTR